jgi:nitroreductase
VFIRACTSGDRGRFLDLLVEKNRSWAVQAPLLMFLAARLHFNATGRSNRSAQFDAGSAWMALALQARKLGLYAHAMAGFERNKAYEVLQVPRETYVILAAIAVGRRGDPAQLPEDLEAMEHPNERKPLADVWCEGTLPDALK